MDLRELIKPVSFEQCLGEILQVLPKVDLPEPVLLHVKKAVSLMKTDRRNNKDPANGINVEELLPKVWRFVMEYEMDAAKVFYEQLAEISSSGSCAQGRSTRILNHYTVHMEMGEKDPVYKACMKIPPSEEL